MADLRIQIELKFSPFLAKWGLSGLLLLACAPELGSENVTLTTYYPAPSGIYAKMVTTDNTYLARDSGSVGIGTAAPAAKLDVNGSIRIANGSQGAGKILTSDNNGVATWQTPIPAGNFGGLFYTNASPTGPCASTNPLTAACSCPPGFSDSSYYFYQAGGIDCGWTAGYTAKVPCYGQYVYIHQCWK